MTLQTFAWILHGNDEGVLDEKRRLSVNWVMPTDGAPGSATEITGSCVFNDADALMWPWRMNIEHWWEATENQVVRLDTGEHSRLDDQHGLQLNMEAEVRRKCGACAAAFSTEIEHLEASEPGAISLPHVFAPLTHLPSGVSQDMLGMSRCFVSDGAAMPYACVPEFTVRMADREVRFTPEGVAASKADGMVAHLKITYIAVYIDDGKPFDTLKFSVLTQPIRAMGKGMEITSVLHAAERSEVGARVQLAFNGLAPLPLLAGTLVPGTPWPADRVSLGLLLNRALGPGLLRLDQGVPVWIWERLKTVPLKVAGLQQTWSEDDKVFKELEKALGDGDSGLSVRDRELLAPLFEQGKPVTDAVIAAGRILANAEGRLALITVWLAAVAVVHLATEPFKDWLSKLAPVLGDDCLAELQGHWWSWKLRPQLRATDALIEQIVTIREDWIAGRMGPGDVPDLQAGYGHALAWLISTSAPTADLDTSHIGKVLQALQERLRLPDRQNVASLGEERDLAVEISFTAPDADADEALRGYAIAIASGFGTPGKKPSKELGMAWITDTAGYMLTGPEKKWRVLNGPDGTLLRLHDTVGATRQNGRSVVAFPYAGKPLSGAMDLGPNGDGVDTLDFAWPGEPWKTPKLAYGLHYWVTGTAIGNGGKVINPAYAGADDRHLRDAGKLPFENGEAFHYLCRVAPGAIIIKADASTAEAIYQMETESRAWHGQQSVATSDRVRVGVICPGDGWKDSAPTAMNFDLYAPDATPLVLERWIEADMAQRLVAAAGAPGLLDSASASLDLTALAGCRDAFLARMRQNPTPKVPRPRVARHPAVRAIGIVIAFDDGAAPARFTLKPNTVIGRGYMDKAKLICQAGTASGASMASAELTITLKAGTIAKVSFDTLVPEEFFASSANTAPLARMASFKGASEWLAATGESYRAFSGTSHWFECLPEADMMLKETNAALDSVQDELAFRADGNDVLAELSLAGGVDARWLKGFLVQRHEWYWTGYPLALPKRLDGKLTLEDWAEAFAGTESLRESHVHLLQTTRALTVAAWRFGGVTEPAPFSRLRLPARHGARFFACILRPILRFQPWLRDDVRGLLEQRVLAQGHLVPAKVDWTDPALRLAPPIVQAAIPLVRSYTSDGERPEASANGTLICLDDVLCRTDALARYSGVGEIVEVDLEETRISNVFEIGANPTHHAGATGEASDLKLPYASHYTRSGVPMDARLPMDWDIRTGRPFGLTYDLDANPKVAQTAMIVRPVGNDVHAYWIMAKVRLRRMLDPHDAWTANGQLPEQGNCWLLGRRVEGDDRIPFDFVVELKTGTDFMLKLGNAQGMSFDAAGSGLQGRRLLCSWHKGQWKSTSEVSWGLQVRDQLLPDDGGQWINIGRHSPYETRLASGELSFKTAEPVPLRMADDCLARRLLLSDYGEAHWLTFIGMPYRHLSIAGSAFRMKKAGGGAIELERTSVVTPDRPEPISRDLLLNPVAPGDMGPGQQDQRVAVELNTFHLLLVFAQINDVAAPLGGQQLGQLAGVYKPTRAAITEDVAYPPLRFVPYLADSKFPDEAVGYIYKFQSVGDNPKDWPALQAALFPPPDMGEAKVRWLPEFIGPIGTAELSNQIPLKGQVVHIDLATANKIEISIQPSRGWLLRKNSGTHWQDDLKGGLCTIRFDGVLALEGSGGRLLAELEEWPGKSGKVSTYDISGAPAEGTWSIN